MHRRHDSTRPDPGRDHSAAAIPALNPPTVLAILRDFLRRHPYPAWAACVLLDQPRGRSARWRV